MNSIDWSNPEARAAHIQAVGSTQYAADLAAHQRKSVVEVVNGYPLRYIASRFGRLVAVVGTEFAYQTIEQAREYAASLPTKPGAA